MGALGLFLGAALAWGRVIPRAGAAGPVVAAVPAIEDAATLVPMTLAPQTPEADEVLGNRLMAFSIALDRSHGREAGVELAAAEAALLGDDVRAALGQGPADALRHLVQVAKASAKAPPLDEASVTAIDVATAQLDNALLAARQPYFVDTSVMTSRTRTGGDQRIIVFYEFAVADSNLYANNTSRVRALRVRRLDRLNWKHTSLGFVNPHRAQAAVLLDQVDEQLARHIVPALAAGAPMTLVTHEEDAARLGATHTTISMRAGELARMELSGLSEAELRDVLADSIERHEVQHRLDVVRPLPLPAVVQSLFRGTSRRADDLRDAVKNELSGYLAQIARDERMPRTMLTLLLRFALNPRTRGSTEAHVAVITAEELAAELGIRGVTPLVTRGRVDEARLVRAHQELTAVAPGMLRLAARRAWSRLFERELEVLSLVPAPPQAPPDAPRDGGS